MFYYFIFILNSRNSSERDENKKQRVTLRLINIYCIRSFKLINDSSIKISFLFNQNNDTVKSISEEIISVFKIDPKYSESLTTLIKKKLIERLDEDSNKKDLRKDKNNNLYFTKSVENKH